MNKGDFITTLAHFTGTTTYYRYTGGLLLTDGTKYFADQTGSYWVMDVIASYQSQTRRNPELRDFQYWTLEIYDNNQASIYVTDGNTDEKMIQQDIPYTDFPFDGKYHFYLARSENHYVLMIPSEY